LINEHTVNNHFGHLGKAPLGTRGNFDNAIHPDYSFRGKHKAAELRFTFELGFKPSFGSFWVMEFHNFERWKNQNHANP
jgi:hypothetical protein